MRFRNLTAGLLTAGLILAVPAVTVPAAYAADCEAYGTGMSACGTSLDSYVLSRTDIPDAYRGFRLTTEHYAYSNAVFDDNWVHTANGTSNEDFPKKAGASVTLPKVGEYTDPQGVSHSIDATLSVVDANGGGVMSYDGLFALVVSPHWWSGLTSKSLPMGYDTSKRLGLTVSTSFTYSDTGGKVPDTFKGVTGFADLDGFTRDGVHTAGEGVELLDGFTGAYTTADTHLNRYGVNGWQGRDSNDDQTNLTTAHSQQHIVSGTFAGSSFTIRYSASPSMPGYASIFSAPVLKDQLVYKVTGQAADQDGKAIRTWTVADRLRTGGTYKAAPPTIDGYRFDRLISSSAPESGTVTDTNLTVTYRYVKQCTVTWKDGVTGGVLKATTVDCGSTLPAAPTIPTHDGYGAGAWDRTIPRITGDVTITATYDRLATLSYDGNGGDGTTAGQSARRGAQVKARANGFARAGYTFTGWNTNADGTGTPIGEGQNVDLGRDTVLYAQWRQVKGIVSWVKTDQETGDVLSGSEWTLTHVVTEQGKQHERTITIADNGESDADPHGGGLKATDLAWGEWTLAETRAPAGHDPLDRPIAFTIDATHTTVNLGDVANTRTPAKVSYEANGGTGTTAGHEAHVGDVVKARANGFTRDGHTFTGWNTKADGSGVTVREGHDLDPLTGDVVLYAQWEKDAPASTAGLARTGVTAGGILLAMLAAGGLGTGLLARRRIAEPRTHGAHVGR